ncbi:MAG: adenylate kinase [Candidatus Westeberhardia cardiocondylae]|nr:adenylate kinase [Candidatus Westeberhardia cardiocondylae]
MRIILLGAPGSGKGTQSRFITNRYKIPQISSGEILRSLLKEDSVLSKKIKKFMNFGILVPDDLIISLIKNRIQKNDCLDGFLLDGFPRTVFQANYMKKQGIKIDFVFEILVPDDVIINRIIGRRIHLRSGRVYHVMFNPPKQNNIDDITGDPLIIRGDDKIEILNNRLFEYHKKSLFLIDFYKYESYINNIKFYKIDGTKEIFEVHNLLSNILD